MFEMLKSPYVRPRRKGRRTTALISPLMEGVGHQVGMSGRSPADDGWAHLGGVSMMQRASRSA
jgi:hypothetical protein